MVSTFHHYHHLISTATGLLKIYSLSIFSPIMKYTTLLVRIFADIFLITFCGVLVFEWLIWNKVQVFVFVKSIKFRKLTSNQFQFCKKQRHNNGTDVHAVTIVHYHLIVQFPGAISQNQKIADTSFKFGIWILHNGSQSIQVNSISNFCKTTFSLYQ